MNWQLYIEKGWSRAIFLLLYYGLIQWVLFHFVSIDYLSDGEYYNGIAQALLNDSSTLHQPGIRNHGEDIGLLLMPGFSYLMYMVYAVFGNSLYSFVAFQIALGAVAVLLFDRLLLRLSTPNLSLILSLILISFLEIWRYNFSTMMEATSVSFLIIVLYFLAQYLSRSSWRNALLLSVFAFALVAINNRFILHVLLAFALLFWAQRSQSKQIFKLLCGGFLFILLMLPWNIRQYQVYRDFVFFGPQRSQRVYDAPKQQDALLSYEDYLSYLKTPSVDRMDPEAWLPLFTEEKYNELVTEYKARKRSYFTDRFLGFFEVVRSDFRLGYGNRSDLIFPPNIYGKKQQARLGLHLLVYGLGFLLLIPALIYTLRRRDVLYGIAFLFLIAHIFVHAYIIYLPRYRLIIVPVILLLSIGGIKQIDHWIKQRSNRES